MEQIAQTVKDIESAKSAATNFDLRISRGETEHLIMAGLLDEAGFYIMCKEIEGPEEDDWVGLDPDDLEGGKLPSHWSTFELWVLGNPVAA